MTKPMEDFPLGKRRVDGRHPYCKPCRRAEEQRRRDAARTYYREYHYFVKAEALYGLSREDYTKLFETQGGACAVCRSVPEGRLHIDHDHETGRVRGLLCADCNIGIGRFKDRPDLLQVAANYLASPDNLAGMR